MPIYAYRCDACGFAKDVLQKVSDAPLTECPSCSRSEFKKQLTAAGFQLKGTGWYVTDFRGGSSGAKPSPDSKLEAKAGETAAPAAKSEAPAASEPSSAASSDTTSAAT
ncbi:MAG: FmdB family transcriptional regulator [Paucimonas sp.]|jgi:putative FmdB family regulatory protein|nr:FmdB family transcriptional regulator [Paucimonas sp.]